MESLPETVKAAKTIKIVTSKQGKSPAVSERPGGILADESEESHRIKANRKDSVCSETALLREDDEQEPEEDRSPPNDDNNEVSLSNIDDRISQSR